MTVADLVLGVDSGGTGTRCVVSTAEGLVLGRGAAGGANSRSTREPVANLVAALREALRGIEPERVAAGVIGMAGAGQAGRDRAEGICRDAWHEAGLAGRPAVTGDLAVAFAAGTDARSGTLLLSGTGAVAASFRDGEIVRRCDGYGWLVGDDGSGVWIGREAVRATLAALDGRDDATVLTESVPDALGAKVQGAGGDALQQAIIGVVFDNEPARLAMLAPVVDRAARDGDAVAIQIISEAARRLLRSAAAVDTSMADLPLVLAGSLLVQPTRLAELVRAGLAELGVTRIAFARDGAAGAAALALRLLDKGSRPDETMGAHRALLGGSTQR